MGMEPVGLDLLGALPDDTSKRILAAQFGADFPLLLDTPTRKDWASWCRNRYDGAASAMTPRLHLVERNRKFRRGLQWISSNGAGPWKEPIKASDRLRIVENLIQPALDQRVQIIAEQRPGFRTKPATSDPDDLKKAEAQQALAEYQYDSQEMAQVIREATFWSGTDGVAFLETYWDADAGPWHELPVFDALTGEEVGTRSMPMGDVRTRVRRIEQVRVAPEATATVKPHWVAIRETLPMNVAVTLYGAEVLDVGQNNPSLYGSLMTMSGEFKNGYELPSIDQHYKGVDTTDRFTVYLQPCEYLPKGAMVIAVGGTAPLVAPLYPGCIPLIRYTDGSADPAYFPTPIMDHWIDSQMRINMLKSRWYEAVRANAGGKLISRAGAISGETLTAGSTTVVEISDPRPFTDLIAPFPMMNVGNDAKELYDREKKTFEDLTGYNDVSRGQFAEDTSGRAILAIREQLERQFAPPVSAAAYAMTEWAKCTLAWCKWGYDMPRTLGSLGESRPDLAREIKSDDLDGAVDVFVDSETLMPMPRSLKLFLLNDMQQRGMMTPQEYRRRMPFAWIKNIGTPDEDQEARARRVVEAIRQSGDPMALPILWMDDEAIHQDILQRELILPDNLEPEIRQAAYTRWMALAAQAGQKQSQMAIPPQQIGQPATPLSQDPSQLPATDQPTLGSNSPIAAAPQQAQSDLKSQGLQGQSEDMASARAFDQSSAL